MAIVRVVGPPARRAEPQFPIEFRGRRFLLAPSAGPVVFVPDLHAVHLPDLAVADELAGGARVWLRPALRPDLHHAAIPSRRIDHRLTLLDRAAGRLFGVDI